MFKTPWKSPPGWSRTLVLSWALALVAAPALATSVLQFGFDELGDHADLVIEGWVVSAESRVESPDGQIATYVRIVVLDRIKGPDVGAELELRFAGGTVAGQTLEYSDMVLPEVGETGIYFVESLLERQLHPLVGWSQGHFLERLDASTGQAGIYTPAGEAVTGIDSAGAIALPRAVLPGTGTARGVRVEDTPPASRPALGVARFKDEIRQSIAAIAPRNGAER